MTGTRRRSYEAGHRPKFLAIVDSTPECDRAVRYAARRAARTSAALLLATIVPPQDAPALLGVAGIMKAEAEAEAQAILDQTSSVVKRVTGLQPETAILHGDRGAAIREVITRDEDIAVLVLAAGTGKEGPGPLVESLAGKGSGSFPIPIAVVPGHLSDDEIDSMA
jgi:nucleotide-binding universal stress UspA family protein